MPNNAEIALCGGFFLIYFIDEFVHFFFGEAIHNTQTNTNGDSHSHQNGAQDYGSINETENTTLLG